MNDAWGSDGEEEEHEEEDPENDPPVDPNGTDQVLAIEDGVLDWSDGDDDDDDEKAPVDPFWCGQELHSLGNDVSFYYPLGSDIEEVSDSAPLCEDPYSVASPLKSADLNTSDGQTQPPATGAADMAAAPSSPKCLAEDEHLHRRQEILARMESLKTRVAKHHDMILITKKA